ncbi:hypothetical protein PO909_000943, partial [Leuciscus waleckii]
VQSHQIKCIQAEDSLPLQSHLTRKVLISAHRNPFTADKLKWAKIIEFSLSVYGPQHFWTEFRICGVICHVL